ncbi:type IV toxin-antitoxin system AbiEi family antitoxin domain-containing protein [Corynebacterium endometrii]|uniref:DUF559 domain-containing protein n=1 Tax=Corynebacterium endometrii TaxID=2488819 RepID=A0A4P7QKD2_9CORY|nr:type IV toxin-antitoxin system AbiEi family antitoxin domain-containing protein [Corynebacterium endometrii]QCB29277.1 hypothetical protein CENDO_10115 [Corynebacterium endometrii]
MDELVVTGLSRSQISRLAAQGKIVKIAPGFYLRREPTPSELAALVMKRWPRSVFTAETARRLHMGQPISFPLDVTSSTGMPRSAYFSVSRCKQMDFTRIGALRCHIPVLAVDFLQEPEAIALLEHAYSGRRGRQRLEQELSGIKRLPARTRKLLGTASIGSDSVPERALVKALRQRGLTVETNKQIGPYFWDAVIPRLKVAVEIDGFQFHSQRDTLIRDHWKSNDATLRGYTVLRYTGSCIKHHLADVVEQISSVGSPDLGAKVHGPVWRWHWVLAPLHRDGWTGPGFEE